MTFELEEDPSDSELTEAQRRLKNREWSTAANVAERLREMAEGPLALARCKESTSP